MLRIDKVDQIEGVTVYGDDRQSNKFYVVPNQPRFRIDDNGNPVFKFLKYRTPVDRGEGRKGGGFCFFDVEFVVPEEKLDRIRQKLQERLDQQSRGGRAPEVEIGSITYTDGSSHLLLQESADGSIVEAINNAGKPSLFGKNISAFSVEFSPDGATLFEKALTGKGGVLQVVYDLNFWTKLPPVTGTVFFRAREFNRLVESFESETERRGFVKKLRSWWRGGPTHDVRKAREEITETLIKSEVAGVRFNFDNAELSDQQKNEIRSWGWETLADAMKRMAFPVPEEEPTDEDQDGDEAQGRSRRKVDVPGNFNDFERAITSRKFSSFRQTYHEEQAVVWNFAPQGTMPNITTLNIDPKEFFHEVDLRDPFFESVTVKVRVNAPFDDLSIHSVDVHLKYPAGGEQKSLSFASPDESDNFAFHMSDEDKSYRYRYTVNYQGESRTFDSGDLETDEQVLTINVDDTGVFALDVLPGDLNFDQVKAVQVSVAYEETGEGLPPIEQQFRIDSGEAEHRIREPIFARRRSPYRYRLKYFMEDGREFEVGWKESNSRQLFVNDPFSATRTVSLRAVGDLEENIQNIFIDLNYRDPHNDFTQSRSVALNKENPFDDWSFPIIDEDAGAVTYSGTIQYRDGRAQEIAETEAKERTILVGERVADRLEVEVFPDLLPLDTLKLARISIRYEDDANDVHETESVVFRPEDAGSSKKVVINLKDGSKREFEWKGLYLLEDGGRKETEPVTSTEDAIFPEVPA